MKLIRLSAQNFRSLRAVHEFLISEFQSLIGENNAGKSNVLHAIDVLLSAGSGGVDQYDFFDIKEPIVLKGSFSVRSDRQRRAWRPYMINDELILEKHLSITTDERTGKEKIEAEFHGYKAEPSEWFLSIAKIKDKESRPNWSAIINNNSLPQYFFNAKGGCTQSDFEKGLARYLAENDVLYDAPDLSHTQALGLQSKAVHNLPSFYLLKAHANYENEIDKRSSSTTFHKLMAALTDRIIRTDPRYAQVEQALQTISELLNSDNGTGNGNLRLTSLGLVEAKIRDILHGLMPSVERVKLKIETGDITTLFAKNIGLWVDDGVETDVLLKGHGLQRCIIFSLLQALILSERNGLINEENVDDQSPPIILGIEEPELYIHPQLGKLFYDTLETFSKKDQVIYTTHSPRFIDVFRYESIALTHKTKQLGTQLKNCDVSAFDDLADKKIFKGFTQLNSDVNELFFARKVLLVEGPEDKVAVTETAKKLGLIKTRPEEVDVTIIVCGGKQSMPFFVRVLNAFGIQYCVLHDTDTSATQGAALQMQHERENKAIRDLAGDRIICHATKLEETLGLSPNTHLKDQFEALRFFSQWENINKNLEGIVNACFEKLAAKTATPKALVEECA